MVAGSDNNRKQVFDVPSDIDAQELLKIAKDNFKCSNVEFEEEKTHGKLSLKQSDRLQVKISSNESEYPDGDSGGEFDGNSDKHYPVCGAAFGLKSELQAGGGTPKSSLASYIPKNTLWKGKNRKKKEKLLVFFFDCKESVLKEWRYNKNPMSPRIVISIIKEHWNDRFAQVKNGDEVPRFEYVDNADDADVRVEFRSEGESWSALGSEAESVSKDKPTMILSFHDKKDDHQICATIVHEFGHVLGLGHEHQHPDYWKVIKNFVNTESMRKSLKLNKVDFNEQWANTTSRSPDIPYDEDSVMHYPTRLEWLREEKYKSRASITKLRDDKELKDEEYKMLSGFLQHVNFIAAEPSKLDVETVVNAYTEENNKHAGSTSKTSKKYLSKDDMPSICHLILLKWKDKEGSDQKLKLVDKICSKWRRMGNLLKIEHGVLDSIWNKNLADGVKCCNEVLEIWLQQGGGNYPVNWNGLCQLLEDLEFLVAAKKLQEAFGKEILN